MTTIVLGGASFIDFVNIRIGGLWEDSTSFQQSSTTAVVDDFDEGVEIAFGGRHFETFDSHGFATSGTVTSLGFFTPGPTIEYSDFSVPAENLTNFFKHGSELAFIKLMIGGDDTITLNPGGAIVYGYNGDDTIIGGASGDQIGGGNGDDVLSGHGGPDLLNGGRGVDRMSGGGGHDTFLFNDVSDSRAGAVDTISGLKNTDSISLHYIDADTNVADDQAFTIVSAFTHDAGQLVLKYNAGHNRTDIRGDVDGDGHADLLVHLHGNHAAFTNFDL